MRKTVKILSILVSPDGLSFWTADGKETRFQYNKTLPPDENLRRGLAFARKKGGRKVTRILIYPDTAKTILIPSELLNAEMVQDYFEINGIAVAAKDRLLASEMDNGGEKVKIITAVDTVWVDLADEVFEGCAEFLSPFVINRQSYLKSHQKNGRDFTAIYLTTQNVYFTVYASDSGRMLYCEALPYSSPADILYYVTDLSGRFDILKAIVHIKGHRSKETRRVLRKTFKKSQCE